MKIRTSVAAWIAASLAFAVCAPPAQAAALTYDDVVRDAPWALAPVAELVQREIFTGYEDGSFRPNRSVSRIETIVATVRHMGLKDKAEAPEAALAKLRAKDAELLSKSYGWAVGYVATAQREKLLVDPGAAIVPDAAADRLWTTILLVRAMGLERDAKRMANETLTFKDAGEIPAEAVGYVAAAVANQLVTGYEDNSFRPKKEVSRAELAAMLDRAGRLLPVSYTSYLELDASIGSISNGKVTLRKDGASNSFSLREGATFVREGRLVDVGALRSGDQVSAVVNGAVLVHVTVTQPAAAAPPAAADASGGAPGSAPGGAETGAGGAPAVDGEKKGRIASLFSDRLMLDERGVFTTYPIQDGAAVTLAGKAADRSALALGDQVTVTVAQGEVTRIVAERTTRIENGRLSGTVAAVGEGTLSIMAQGVAETYPVSKDVRVTVNSRSGAWSHVGHGDQVSASIQNGEVISVSLKKLTPVSTEAKGYVAMVSKKQVSVASNGRTSGYSLHEDATLIREGREVGVDALRPGDEVDIVLWDDELFFLNVVTPVDEEEFSVIQGVFMGSKTKDKRMTEIIVAVDYGGNKISRTFPVDKSSVIVDSTGVTENPAYRFNRTMLEVVVSDGVAVHVSEK